MRVSPRATDGTLLVINLLQPRVKLYQLACLCAERDDQGPAAHFAIFDKGLRSLREIEQHADVCPTRGTAKGMLVEISQGVPSRLSLRLEHHADRENLPHCGS